jgi:rubrerythrin
MTAEGDMGIRFNADEVFQIAIKIEENGAKFYRRASEKFPDQRMRKLLGDLADMENQHKLIFTTMRDHLTGKQKKAVVFDPEDQTKEYLLAMADGRVFDINADPDKYLTPDQTPQKILKTALGFEKDSIAFYTGIRDMVPEELGRDKIETVIREEMYHIIILNAELAKL